GARTWRLATLVPLIAPAAIAITAGVLRRCHQTVQETEYAFEMAVSTVRYGPGKSGQDVVNLGAKRVLVFTDNNLAELPPFKKVADSLASNSVPFDVYPDVRVEPTDSSFKAAIKAAGAANYDAFIAVGGGGSVIDTAKSCQSLPDFLDYVNAPIGRGLPVTHELKPLIAVPTTSGTGSETTGVAVFDLESMHAKTGIANRALRPTLGLIDPDHTASMPNACLPTAASMLSVTRWSPSLHCRSIRERRDPTDPKLRPAYQGSNPISDVWCRWALDASARYFRRAVRNRATRRLGRPCTWPPVWLALASAMLGCTCATACPTPSPALLGTSVSSGGTGPKAIPISTPLIPHGLSVVITAPKVFEFTGAASPDRHLEAARLLGADVTWKKREDAGKVLSDQVRQLMHDLDVPDGLQALGFDASHIDSLVEGVLPQQRLRSIAPCPQTRDDIAGIYQASMRAY
uniref:hydroxyacid-oxoacid transhydrogenase n=1 Tax=Macrostomum lignano TaxID=282301 RepID=A0A1I8IXV9_9PLAT